MLASSPRHRLSRLPPDPIDKAAEEIDTGDTRPPGTGDASPPVTGDTRPPGTGDTKPPRNGEKPVWDKSCREDIFVPKKNK